MKNQVNAMKKNANNKLSSFSKNSFLVYFILLFSLTSITTNAAADEAMTSKKAKPQNEDQSDIDTIVITATEVPIEIKKYPGSITVLDSRNLESNTTTIEALSKVTGVTTGADFGRNAGQTLSIRGFSGDRIIVEQDGIKRNMLMYAKQISSMRSDNDLLKYAEVVKGSSSITHGSGAIGGVVSLQTKNANDFIPTGDDYGFATKIRLDSNNYREVYAAAAVAPTSEKYEFLIYGKRGNEGNLKLADRVSDVEYVNNNEDLFITFLKAGYHLSDNQKIDLSYYDYKNKTKVTWNAMASALYPSTGPTVGEITQRDWNANYTFNPDNELINIKLSAYFARASYDRSLHASGINYENKDRRIGFKFKNQSDFKLGSTRNEFVFGADYEYLKEDAIYIRNGVRSDFGSMPNKQKNLGVFLENHSYLFSEKLMVILGARYDKYSSEISRTGVDYNNDLLSPRLGASYELIDNLYFLANYSQAFRSPKPDETSIAGPANIFYWYLPNANLKAEKSREYEMGFSYKKDGVFNNNDNFNIKAMYFYGKIKDMIDLVVDYSGPTPPASNYYATYKNVDHVTRKGIEVSLNYDLYPLGLNLDYEHLKQTDDKTGKRTPNSFADKIQLGIYYYPIESIKFEVNSSHWFKPNQNPKSTVSAGKTYYYVDKDFTIVNTKVSWFPDTSTLPMLGKEFEVIAGVNNIFNSPYVNAALTYPTTRVGKGTNFYLSMSTKF